MKYKAVLFDFDGTLANTMGAHYDAWAKACLDFEIELNSDDYYPLEGMNLYDIARIILKENHIIGDINKLVLKKEKLYLENSKIKLFPGVKCLLKKLHL